MVTKKISRRGRPRKFDIDEGLVIAQQLFHERGFDGVGVAELSKKMGITAPSLYSAFGSKRELFEDVLKKYVAENGWMVAIVQDEGSVQAMIARLFQRASKVYTADNRQRGCLVLDGTRNSTDEKACELSAKFRQGTWQMLSDRIADEFPAQAPTLANYVMTILIGLSAAARDGRSQAELEGIGEIAAAGFSTYLERTIE